MITLIRAENNHNKEYEVPVYSDRSIYKIPTTNIIWMWCLDSVSYLPWGITLIVLIILNWCLDSIAINFNWSTRLWNIVPCSISRMKLRKPLLTCLIVHRTFSIHCTNLFLCFSCIFAFLKIIRHNMLKMLRIFFQLQY